MVTELWWCGADAIMEARQFASRRCGSFHGCCCGANVVWTTNDGSASMVDLKLVQPWLLREEEELAVAVRSSSVFRRGGLRRMVRERWRHCCSCDGDANCCVVVPPHLYERRKHQPAEEPPAAAQPQTCTLILVHLRANQQLQRSTQTEQCRWWVVDDG